MCMYRISIGQAELNYALGVEFQEPEGSDLRDEAIIQLVSLFDALCLQLKHDRPRSPREDLIEIVWRCHTTRSSSFLVS